MAHVSLASLQCASGAVRGAACRTRLRRTDRPVRASKSPIVLVAGQACLIVALGCALYGIAASLYGARWRRREWVASGPSKSTFA